MQAKVFQKRMLRWYQKTKRDLPWRKTRNPYAIWISEAMLQQTQVKTVIPYYERFLQRFATVQALAKADEQTVLKLWEGLGYYRRARFLHAGAKKIVSEWHGVFPSTAEAIRSLPGVGEYMQGAIGSIAFELPLPLVDGNVKRIFSRIFYGRWKKQPDDKDFWELARELMPHKSCGDYNQSLMELGATVCTPKNPSCLMCPVGKACGASSAGKISEASYQSPKTQQPKKYFVALLVERGPKLLLRLRSNEKLLGGLWEFPMLELLDAKNLPADIAKHSTYVGRETHTYTHFKQRVEIRTWNHKVLPKNVSGTWIEKNKIAELPLSKINQKILGYLN